MDRACSTSMLQNSSAWKYPYSAAKVHLQMATFVLEFVNLLQVSSPAKGHLYHVWTTFTKVIGISLKPFFGGFLSKSKKWGRTRVCLRGWSVRQHLLCKVKVGCRDRVVDFQLNSEWVVEFQQPKQLFVQFMCVSICLSISLWQPFFIARGFLSVEVHLPQILCSRSVFTGSSSWDSNTCDQDQQHFIILCIYKSRPFLW